MQFKLKVIGTNQEGRELKINQPQFMVGRADDCHLRPHTDQVSRYHCSIMTENNTITVRDMGSRNGTFVNDEAISGECELKHGDRLRIGPLEFEVVLNIDLKGEKKPKVTSIKEAAARTATTKDDLNVENWLNEGPEVSQDDTRTIDLKALYGETPTEPAKKEPTKPPPPTANSRDAANDALSKFLKRR